MNKIEFEDLLSKYIENDLSLADRKKIEAYLNDNKDCLLYTSDAADD